MTPRPADPWKIIKAVIHMGQAQEEWQSFPPKSWVYEWLVRVYKYQQLQCPSSWSSPAKESHLQRPPTNSPPPMLDLINTPRFQVVVVTVQSPHLIPVSYLCVYVSFLHSFTDSPPYGPKLSCHAEFLPLNPSSSEGEGLWPTLPGSDVKI